VKISKVKLLFATFISLIGIYFAAPNFFHHSFLSKNTISLGLDLQGGSHLLYEVDFDSYLNEQFENLTDTVRKELRNNKIGYIQLRKIGNSIEIIAKDNENISQIKKILNKIDRNITIETDNFRIQAKYVEQALNNIEMKLIDQSIEIIRVRIDSTGTKEPIIQRQGRNYILLQVPGVSNPNEIKQIVGKTAKLTFHDVNEDANIIEALNGKVPSNCQLIKSSDKNERPVLIYKKSLLTGDMLNDASASFYEGRAVVNFSFNNIGAKIFGEVTKKNVGKRLAIVLDNKLLSDPVINVPISGGSGFIQGNFTTESANELALLLRAGSLPANLKIIEERNIGPTLGLDSIESGTRAGIIGLISVMIFMFLVYGIWGIFANIALILAVIYIFALLSILGATLTLPGIAGIILTMGMAVDANVLIYERIKEETRNGRSMLVSIRQGFETAFGTILDSNITTLIAALLLYIFGSGAIRGFAVALSIGIISSMFASIVITKLLVDLWIRYVKPTKTYL
jgi:preprotein translocase subunit SecD